jgi:hypothetical protein
MLIENYYYKNMDLSVIEENTNIMQDNTIKGIRLKYRVL